MRRFLINNFFEDEDDYKDWILEYHMDLVCPLVISALIFILMLYI